MGRFGEQVERYYAAFPADQIHIVNFRDWTADPRAAYLEILEFLGLADDGRTSFPQINPGMTYRSRRIARLVIRPPAWVRTAARLMRQLPFGERLYGVVRKVGFLSTTGYRHEITPELRDQIKRYYAADNALLEARLGAVERELTGNSIDSVETLI